MAGRKELPARPPKRPPTHPGEVLREMVLPELRLTIPRAATELGVSRQMLHRIVSGRAPITPEMAVRVGHWLGNGPGLWLRMQQAYDVWHAERELAPTLKRIPTHASSVV
jgi:antitoxin HigA-1